MLDVRALFLYHNVTQYTFYEDVSSLLVVNFGKKCIDHYHLNLLSKANYFIFN